MAPHALNPTTRNPLPPQPTPSTHTRTRQTIRHNRRLNTVNRDDRDKDLLLQPQVVRCAPRPRFLQRFVDSGAGNDLALRGVGDEVEEDEAADEAVREGLGAGVGCYFASWGDFGGGWHFGWFGGGVYGVRIGFVRGDVCLESIVYISLLLCLLSRCWDLGVYKIHILN